MSFEAWTRRYAREAWRGGPDEALGPWLATLPPGPVVDLGAGGGRTHAALPAGAVAVDWVRASLAGLARPVVADLAALPFRDASFASAVAVHAFGHLDKARLARAAREATRVLRAGGGLLVVEFAPGDLRAGEGEGADGGRVREGILTRYASPEEVASWFPGARPVASAVLERRTRYGSRRRSAVRFEKL